MRARAVDKAKGAALLLITFAETSRERSDLEVYFQNLRSLKIHVLNFV